MAERTPTYPAGYDPAPRLTVKELLEADLRRMKMAQKDLAAELEISQGAIGNWVADDAVPWGRYSQIMDIFGPNSVLGAEMRRRRIQNPHGDLKESSVVVAPEATEPAVRFSRSRTVDTPSRDPSPSEPPPAPVAEGHYRQTMTAFEANLGDTLRPYLAAGKAMRQGLDYLSPKLAVDVTLLSNSMLTITMITAKLFRMAVFAKRDTVPERLYLVVAVQTEPNPSGALNLRMSRLIADADLVGVKLVVVPDGTTGADIVSAIEYGHADVVLGETLE